MKIKNILTTMAVAVFLLSLFFIHSSFATTANPSPASPGYEQVVIPLMGAYTSSRTGIVKWKAPFAARVLYFGATARASSGTSPTLTVNLKSGSTSMLSTPVSVTAGSIADAVLATTPNLTDEGTITIDLTTGGTSPVWHDLTLFMLLKRR